MNLEHTIMAIVVALAGGYVIGAFTQKNHAAFRLFTKAVLLIAFYRTFGNRSDVAISQTFNLIDAQLKDAYHIRDMHRGFHDKAGDREAEICEGKIELLLKEKDYAIGLLFLEGFGKLAMRLIR